MVSDGPSATSAELVDLLRQASSLLQRMDELGLAHPSAHLSMAIEVLKREHPALSGGGSPSGLHH